MKIFKSIFFLFILISSFQSCEDEHSKSSTSELAVIMISAEHKDLFSDSTGIYVKGIGTASNWQGMKANYFDGRKIDAKFEYFEHSELLISQNIGLKVSGGGSRKQAQKSFNIYTGKKYGKKGIDFPFFNLLDIDSYNHLRLRNSGQDWRKTHLRDALMHSLSSELHMDVQAYKPVVVYLNDKYWGIYNLREKFNKSYIRSHHNYGKNVTLDILELNQKVKDGSSLEYANLINYIENNDLENDQHYLYVLTQVDILNFIDYFCSQIYFANTDWPGNNIKFWKPQIENGKWRWFLHDTDLGFARAPLYGHPGGIEHNTLLFCLNDSESTPHHNKPWATFLFRQLLKNKEFQILFKSHFEYLLETEFSEARVLFFIDSLSNGIRSEIPNHIARWAPEDHEFYQSVEEWEANVELLRKFARQRPTIVKSHLDEYF